MSGIALFCKRGRAQPRQRGGHCSEGDANPIFSSEVEVGSVVRLLSGFGFGVKDLCLWYGVSGSRFQVWGCGGFLAEG